MTRRHTAYSSENAVAVLDGQEVVGLADGDEAIAIAQLTESGSLMVGAKGDSIFSASANRGATITLRLQPTSPTHRLLVEKRRMQDEGDLRGFSFSVINTNTNEGGAANSCFVQKSADHREGEKASNREWVLVTGEWSFNIPDRI